VAANALKLKVQALPGVKQPPVAYSPTKRHLPNTCRILCVFGRFRAHSFATDFEGRTPEEPLFMRIAERSKARTWLG